MSLKLDLFFGLFVQEGVTHDMLKDACRLYSMAPTKGRSKFFPDPGALFELLSDRAHGRKRDLARLNRALDVLDGKVPPEWDEPTVSRERMRSFAETMRGFAHERAPEAPPPKPSQGENKLRGAESGSAAPRTNRCSTTGKVTHD